MSVNSTPKKKARGIPTTPSRSLGGPDEKKAEVITLSYEALLRGDDLSAEVEKAFGVDGLGILTVSGVPGLAETRESLLPLASEFAALPDEVKAKYEKPEMYYSFGWSHGREKLQGRPDYAKGSYYANPLFNKPFDDPKLIEQYPAFAAPNVWPDEVPKLEDAFMRTGQLVHKVRFTLQHPHNKKPTRNIADAFIPLLRSAASSPPNATSTSAHAARDMPTASSRRCYARHAAAKRGYCTTSR